MTAPSSAVLADLARTEAESHPPRTPERRAACHLWVALVTSPTTEGAQRAVITFGAPETQADALELLERLAELRDLDRLMRQPGTLAGPRENRDDEAAER